jgi:F0F1-type ATP synthase assembly protein I
MSSLYTPESDPESARRSGLGYAAGITFFATVAFTLFIGWGADLILGTKPWGIVVGIVLGAVIAFIQFFRITNRIYQKPKDLPAVKPLSSSNDEERL